MVGVTDTELIVAYENGLTVAEICHRHNIQFRDASLRLKRNGVNILRGRRPGIDAAKASAVMQAVCEQYNVTIDELRIACRAEPLVTFRHIAAYLLHKIGLSFPQAALMLGYSDHTSVMHAVKRVRDKCRETPWLQAHVTKIEVSAKRIWSSSRKQNAVAE
jgi:chromosomal replication initiation ATPase DnaA